MRETRRFKTKGFAVSFGDIMLPLVGIVAVGLLLVAGKFFFFSGLNAEKTSLPVISGEGPSHPKNVNPDLELSVLSFVSKEEEVSRPLLPLTPDQPESAEGERPQEVVLPRQTPAYVSLDALAVPMKGENTLSESASRETQSPAPAASQKPKPPAKKIAPVKAAVPVPKKPAPAPAPAKPAHPPSKQAQNSWRVQVGAYTSKPVAEEAAKKLEEAGYKTTIASGPKFHRLLVLAGTSKSEAHSIVGRVEKLGFPGAFPLAPGREE
ncbi:MAG: SPOR domain-containing protein [Fretibacterium sp.]|nr:SPOR domain-containing protein [Fretibacterium sp.]